MSEIVTTAIQYRYRDDVRTVVDLQDKGGQVYLLPGMCDVWHLAVCANCFPRGPMPFRTSKDRDRWAIEHMAGSGHKVHAATQVTTP